MIGEMERGRRKAFDREVRKEKDTYVPCNEKKV